MARHSWRTGGCEDNQRAPEGGPRPGFMEAFREQRTQALARNGSGSLLMTRSGHAGLIVGCAKSRARFSPHATTAGAILRTRYASDDFRGAWPARFCPHRANRDVDRMRKIAPQTVPHVLAHGRAILHTLRSLPSTSAAGTGSQYCIAHEFQHSCGHCGHAAGQAGVQVRRAMTHLRHCIGPRHCRHSARLSRSGEHHTAGDRRSSDRRAHGIRRKRSLKDLGVCVHSSAFGLGLDR